MKKKMRIIGASVISLALICLVLTAALAVQKISAEVDTNDGIICEGIYINEVSIAGMNEQQAIEAVDEYIAARMATEVRLTVEDDVITTTLEELGYTCEENDFVAKALNYGNNGNIIERYKEQEDIKNENIVYELVFSLEEENVKKFVKENCKSYEIEPVNATLTREDDSFVITDSQDGFKIDYDATATGLYAMITEDWNADGIEMTAYTEVIEPDVTREECERCTDLLGSYSTYAGSSGNRVLNIQNATNLIDGTVVYPGETFSTEEKLVPFTVENGYYEAGAYSQGKVINELGGGVCQVSSTLYNAILLAELEVVERSPHSMIVSYVKPSMDAAIAEGYKDFKFKNDTDVPVYVEGYNYGGYVYFNIYGEDTRSENRKVEYVSEIMETIQPGKDVVVKDDTKPETYQEITQSAHVGYKSRLWKVVTVDGVEESREQINYSYYSASPNYVVKGTQKVEEKPEKPEKTDKPDKPEKTDKPEKPEKPEETKKPEETEPPVVSEEPTETEEPVTPEEPTENPSDVVG